jgi:hypothetical protein
MRDFARRTDASLAALVVSIRPKRRADVKARLVRGEMLVLDRHEERMHQLNRTATYIWERCDGQQTTAEIAEQVCKTFEVDEPTALKDVIGIVRRLQKLKLLENA